MVQIVKPEHLRYCKLLAFAPAGAGKTVLLGSAQEDERTSPSLMLDFEGGSESLTGLDIDVAPIKTWDDFNEVYEMLASGDHGYKSVLIDSISEVHKWVLLNILDEVGATRKDPDLLEQRDYGKATVLLRRLLRSFRDLPLHVFYTAHAKEVEIPREGRVRVPDLAGQMAEEVAGLMSVCGYLAQFEENGENHRTLLLHSFPRYRIKARTPWKVEAPPEIVDPTVGDILDALGYVAQENGAAAPPKARRRRRAPLKKDTVPDDATPPGDGTEGEGQEPTEEEQPREGQDPKDDGQADPSGGDN